MSSEEIDQREVAVGDRLTLEIGRVAHGGHFIAHSDQFQTVTFFVRGAISGERVVAEVVHRKKRIALAEVVEVITPSPHRVMPPCSYFRERACGGCDFQHVDLAFQRKLKGEVVHDSLARLAGIEIDVECFPASPQEEEREAGFRWRSRMDFTLTPDYRLALHPHRSDSLTEVTECLIADGNLDIESINHGMQESLRGSSKRSGARPWDRIRVGVSSTGEVKVSSVDQKITMEVLGKKFPISLGSFWQPHKAAAETLVKKMRTVLRPQPGERVLDLYGGVGLFTAFLRDDVGASGHVTLVESDTSALQDAREIFKGDDRVSVMGGKVEEVIKEISLVDRILLDPPRAGVATAVIGHFARLRPRQILYISCDPATLARDAKALTEVGYRLTSIEAFDLFPMTEHIESVANFILDSD